jgi:hypothetical protein
MQHHRIAMTAAALVLAGGIGAGSYELASSGDHANPANSAAATMSSLNNGGSTGTNSADGATLTQGGGVTSGSVSRGTMTSIFVTEDDAQNGPDHVDAHRTISQVISPYTQTGKVDSSFSSSVSASQQTPPPPPPKPKGLLDDPLSKKIAETQVYK